MDGNGRWAEERGLPRIMGHKAGAKTVQGTVRAARELGIEVLTLYAFSTENWQRPPQEVKTLMGLLKSYLQSELEKMLQQDIRLCCLGQQEKLPKDVGKILQEVIERTAGAKGMTLNLALSYGGRSEIVRAVQQIAEECVSGKLGPSDITEDLVNQHLYTAGLPDPDLLIRTGGEYRLSNFLLWQTSYAEIYVTETKWPDFSRESLLNAIADFQHRKRRFGRPGEQATDTAEAS
jgi:undecaprenyl diphosphate synthase